MRHVITLRALLLMLALAACSAGSETERVFAAASLATRQLGCTELQPAESRNLPKRWKATVELAWESAFEVPPLKKGPLGGYGVTPAIALGASWPAREWHFAGVAPSAGKGGGYSRAKSIHGSGKAARRWLAREIERKSTFWAGDPLTAPTGAGLISIDNPRHEARSTWRIEFETLTHQKDEFRFALFDLDGATHERILQVSC